MKITKKRRMMLAAWFGICCALASGCGQKKTETTTTADTQKEIPMYDQLTDEQKEYLEKDQMMEVESINNSSYEMINWTLLGTGLELYNPSSGVEKMGLRYETDQLDLTRSGTELITWDDLYEIRLKEKEMRIEDFQEYVCEIKPIDKETDDGTGYELLAPMKEYKNTYARVYFYVDGTKVFMKFPHLFCDDGDGTGNVFSVLYNQALREAFFEQEPYSYDGKLVVGLQYTSLTDHSAVIEMYNSTDKDVKVVDDLTIYRIDDTDSSKKTEVCSIKGEKTETLDKYSFTIRPITFFDNGKKLEPGRYLLVYGKNKAGYAYKEIETEF